MQGIRVSIGDTDFGVQVSIGVVGRVVTALVAFLGSILLARVLGPESYGMFYLLLAVVAFLDNPVTGWAEACRKRLTETGFLSEEAIGSTLLGILLSSAAIFMVTWLVGPYIEMFTGSSDGWLLISVLFAGMVVYHTVKEVLKSTEQFGMSTWLEASRDTVRVLTQAGLVLAGFGVAGMVGGMVLANLVVAPVVLYFIGVRPRLPSAKTLGDVWAYARYSIPGGVVGTAQSRIDHILLGFLVGPAVVGNYEVALKLTIPAMFVAGVAQNGLMGRISNLQSRGEDFAGDIQNNLAYASILGVPLFFGALVMADPVVVTLYSNQYAAAAPFLVGLALFRLLRTQKAILVATINGLDKPNLNLRISIVIFTFNVVVGVALLFAVGPIGVVIATVVSELLGYLFRARYVRSLVPTVNLVSRPFVEQLTSGLVMAAVVRSARIALPLATWPYVFLLVAIGVVTYFTVLAGISHEFRATALAIAADTGLR